MNNFVTNQFLNQYFLYIPGYFIAFCILCNNYKLRISKRNAYILAFTFSNYYPIVDSLLTIYDSSIANREVLELLFKTTRILGEFTAIAFILIVLDIAWYKCYWLIILLRFLMVFPHALTYSNFFIINGYQSQIILPLSFELLPEYLTSIIVIFPCNIIVYLCTTRLLQKNKNNTKSEISKYTWTIVYFIWGILVINTNKHTYDENTLPLLNHAGNIMNILLAFAFVMIVIVISMNYSEKKLLKVENNLLKEQVKIQYESYLSTQQQELNIRKLYHDIGNHIKTIEILVSKGENQKAIEYTEHLSNQYKIINNQHFCNNKIINAVLSQKIKECKQNGITPRVDAQIPDHISISDMDLMSVFSNLLDNAIEGCLKNDIGSNFIEVRALLIGDYFVVKVMNSKPIGQIMAQNKTFLTTKMNDKSMHGYGLRIIKEIVERYDGNHEYMDHGTEFSAMVMLNMNSIQTNALMN